MNHLREWFILLFFGLVAVAPLHAITVRVAIEEPPAPAPLDTLINDAANDAESLPPELYEEWTLPDGKTILNGVLFNPTDDPSPAHRVVLRSEHDNTNVGFLLQRDAGEPDGIDLFRGFVTLERKRTTMIAGSFRALLGLGWLYTSSASWSAPDRPRSLFYSHRSVLYPNTSSEEGRGLTGGGVTTSLSGTQNDKLVLFVGFTPLDLTEKNGYQVPRGVQGFHPNDDSESANQSVAGIHYGFNPASVLSAEISAIAYLSSTFGNALNDNAPNELYASRFQNLDATNAGASLCLRTNDLPIHILCEIAAQKNGGFSNDFRIGKAIGNKRFVAARIWGANGRFMPLDSRPDLPITNVPLDQRGFQLAFESRALRHIRSFRAGIATVQDDFNNRRQHGLWSHIEHDLFGKVRTVWGIRYRSYNESENLVSLKNITRFSSEENDFTFRSEALHASDGGGYLVGIQVDNHQLKAFGISLATTYLDQHGSLGRMTVVEPSAPGVFPFLMATGRQWRTSLKASWSPIIAEEADRALSFWIKGTLVHRLNDPDTPRDDTLLVGFSWTT